MDVSIAIAAKIKTVAGQQCLARTCVRTGRTIAPLIRLVVMIKSVSVKIEVDGSGLSKDAAIRAY